MKIFRFKLGEHITFNIEAKSLFFAYIKLKNMGFNTNEVGFIGVKIIKESK